MLAPRFPSKLAAQQLKGVLYVARPGWPTIVPDKEHLRLSGFWISVAAFDIAFERTRRRRMHRYEAGFSELGTADLKETLIEIDIPALESRRFG